MTSSGQRGPGEPGPDEQEPRVLDHGTSEDDGGYDDEPAPVVTDEGVFGRLPRRFDEYEEERPARRGLARLLVAVLALAAGPLLLALAATQVTSEAVAVPAIARVVDALTGLEGQLALHAETMRAEAETQGPAGAAIAVPGFAVRGASVSRAEVLDGTVEEWHALLRERAARAIYREGVDAWAPEGGAAGRSGRFSASNGAYLFMAALSERNHGLASLLVLPLAVVAALALAGIVALGAGFGRFGGVGLALALASVPSLGAWLVATALLSTFNGTSPLAQELHTMASELAGAPLRNGMAVLAAGVAIGVTSVVLARVFRSED